MKVLATILLNIFLLGCGGKELSKEDFMKIKSGMTQSEVVKILGSPDKNDRAGSYNGKSMQLLSWGEDIEISLLGGKVETVTYKGEELLNPAE